MTVAVMPVKGRGPLLKLTVTRLVRQGCKVICIGSTPGEEKICTLAGAEFLMIPDNICLGAKWQYGIDQASRYNPKSIMIMGSSDMVQDGWIERMNEELDKGYAMVGTEGIYFLDIQPHNKKRMCRWAGYSNGRKGEPIGTGRMISAKALDLINWQLINKTINSSIDHSICVNLNPVKDKFTKLIHNVEGLVCLSISTYKWTNMHNFERECLNQGSYLVNPDDIISQYFPEMFNLFKE